MNEYDLYTRILAPRLRPSNQELLIEEKHLRKPHKCTVISDAVDEYSLYRYDCDEEKGCFLPFLTILMTVKEDERKYLLLMIS